MELFNKIMSIFCFFASGFSCAMLVNDIINNNPIMSFVFTFLMFFYYLMGEIWLEDDLNEN